MAEDQLDNTILQSNTSSFSTYPIKDDHLHNSPIPTNLDVEEIVEISSIQANTDVGFKEITEISSVPTNIDMGSKEIIEISSIPTNLDMGFKEIAEISSIESNGSQTIGSERSFKKVKRAKKSSKNECVKMDKLGGDTAFDKKRKEMEALRYVDVEKQHKIWIEVYCGLGPIVSKEYDALLPSNNPNSVHFDPRQQFLKNKASKNSGEESRNVGHFDSASGVDGSPDVLEDCCEDDDSDDADYTSIQKPAFMVSGEPNFDSGPPQDGLEYLRRVRWEAEQIPRVKVAKVEKSILNKEQTVYMPTIPDIAVCPEHLMPSKEWEDAFLHDFSELRLALSQQSVPVLEECSQHLLDDIILEKHDNLTINRVYSFDVEGKSTDSLLNIDGGGPSPSDPSNGDSVEWPTLATIKGMDSVARVSTLKKRVKLEETMNTMTRNECAWLFALCAAVDTPLDGDTSASLRSLLRKCANLRAEKSELDDEVIMLNILATISGKYFHQSEK